MGKKTVELEKKRHVNVSSWQFYLFGKSQSAQKRRWWSGSITDVCIFMTVTTQETQSNALKEFFSNPTLNLGEINEESILKSAKKKLGKKIQSSKLTCRYDFSRHFLYQVTYYSKFFRLSNDMIYCNFSNACQPDI